jgi:hypothetical protein
MRQGSGLQRSSKLRRYCICWHWSRSDQNPRKPR